LFGFTRIAQTSHQNHLKWTIIPQKNLKSSVSICSVFYSRWKSHPQQFLRLILLKKKKAAFEFIS